MAALLEVRDLHTYYGRIQALKGVSLDGRGGRGRHPHRRQRRRQDHHAHGGLGHQPRRLGRDPLPRPSRSTNLAAARDRPPRHLAGARGAAHPRRACRSARTSRWAPSCAATRPAIARRPGAACSPTSPSSRSASTQPGGTLSGGEQQMLAIGRALMGRPKLLLLDEPSLGLAPQFVRAIFDIVREINRAGTTVFLVEQNVHMALAVASRGYVLETGSVVLADTRGAPARQRGRQARLPRRVAPRPSARGKGRGGQFVTNRRRPLRRSHSATRSLYFRDAFCAGSIRHSHSRIYGLMTRGPGHAAGARLAVREPIASRALSWRRGLARAAHGEPGTSGRRRSRCRSPGL